MAIPERALTIMAGQPTISGQIRALAAAGYTRSEIKDFVDRSYQQVRQVLVDEEKRRARLGRTDAPAVQQGMAEGRHAYQPPPAQAGDILVWADVSPEGSLWLPEPARAALEVAQGGRVLVQVHGNGSVALLSARTAMLQAQAMMRPFIKPGVSVVAELLAERRAEAARENDGG
jgi:hypothetical protein